MKRSLIIVLSSLMLAGIANAGTVKEHCVTRNVTSNDNSLQGLSKVCITLGNYQPTKPKDDCKSKRS